MRETTKSASRPTTIGVRVSAEQPSTCRVAICDDQSAFRQLLSILLGAEAGLELVGEASNGEQAVELAAREQPDVLLLDIAMPVLDGLEALPRIREVSPKTRVVMLTGLASKEVRRRALEAGAAAYVEKGIDVTDLAGRITELCAVG